MSEWEGYLWRFLSFCSLWFRPRAPKGTVQRALTRSIFFHSRVRIFARPRVEQVITWFFGRITWSRAFWNIRFLKPFPGCWWSFWRVIFRICGGARSRGSWFGGWFWVGVVDWEWIWGRRGFWLGVAVGRRRPWWGIAERGWACGWGRVDSDQSLILN